MFLLNKSSTLIILTNNSTGNMSSADKKGEEIASEWLWKTIPILLFCVGITGNILTIAVLIRLEFRRQPTLTFLMFLSITNTVILLTVLPRYWMFYTFNFDLKLVSSVNCKMYYFVVYFSMQYSSWILVGVSIERAIKTYFPFKYKRWYTIKRVIIGSLIALFTLIFVNIHFFITNGINDERECGSLSEHYKNFDEFVYVYIDFCITSLVPFLIMLVCNIFLIRKIRKIQKQRPNMMVGRYVHLANSFSHKMTKILVLCTSYFLVTTAPLCVYFIVDSHLKPGFKQSNDESALAKMGLIWTVCYFIGLSNYCVNFFLYTALNDAFYNELRAMIRCKPSLRRSCLTATKYNNTVRRIIDAKTQGIQLSHSDENNPNNEDNNTVEHQQRPNV